MKRFLLKTGKNLTNYFDFWHKKDVVIFISILKIIKMISRYNFKPEIKHRTLNFEEAEAEWERRDQIINKYALMQQKRDDDVIDDVFGDSKQKASTSSGFKIHGAEDERLIFDSCCINCIFN